MAAIAAIEKTPLNTPSVKTFAWSGHEVSPKAPAVPSNEVLEYREDFGAIAEQLASFWQWRGAEKRRGDKATHESVEGEAVATLQAVGRIVERRALALAEKATTGDAKLAADVMASIREQCQGSPFDRQGKEEETDDKV